MKNPSGILPHVWSPSWHTFTEGRQNIFIINLIDSLTFRHPINVDYPPDIEKNNNHCFEFGLAHARFLLPLGLWALQMHGLSLSLWII